MQELEVKISTADGEMNTFVSRPDRPGPFPLIVFLMDAPGKREELHDMARRLATVGYYVMLPNLYYRRVQEFVIERDGREAMMGHMNSLSNAMVCKDIESLLQFAETDVACDARQFGAVGYCMSGPFAFAAAAHFPDRLVASASLHGVRLFVETEHSPHRQAHAITGEMYFGCAESDEWAPPEMITQLDTYLSETDLRYTIEWYPQTEHGFVFPTRDAKYHKGAAERHWERLFDLYRRNGLVPA